MYVWILAGLDNSGGAGLQNDIKTFSFFNIHTCPILTCVAAQDNAQVKHIAPVSLKTMRYQFEAIKNQFKPSAVKIGMIKSKKIIRAVAKFCANLSVPIIADPILKTSSQYQVLSNGEIAYYKKYLFPIITVLTPNVMEAEKLLNCMIRTKNDIEAAGRKFISFGIKNIIIKGGDQSGCKATDYWTDGKDACWLSLPKIADKTVRGTGCAFASALTAYVMQNNTIKESFIKAKRFVYQGILQATATENMVSFLAHNRHQNTLPYYEKQQSQFYFAPCHNIDFYPIVDNVIALQNLINQGVKTIQLRIKHKSENEIEAIIKHATTLSHQHDIHLFINDYWCYAIRYKAYGVHLGQEDLNNANLCEIQAAGLRLGISTHNRAEFISAAQLNPSYIAIGPIFATLQKPNLMPLSLAAIAHFRKLTTLPLVVIGGIKLHHVAELIRVNIDGIAVISGVDPDDQKNIAQWLAAFSKECAKSC